MNVENIKKNACVLIPYWIANQIKRNGLSMDTVFDLKKLLTICSLEDVAMMAKINTDLSPQFVGESLGPFVGNPLLYIWHNKHQASLTQVGLAMVALSDTDTLTSRFVDTRKNEPAKEFESYHLTLNDSFGGGLAYVLKRGEWMDAQGTPFAKSQIALVEQYLRKAFGFSKFHTLAQDSVFRTYLKNLWSEETQAA
jgi:hypothetical protein